MVRHVLLSRTAYRTTNRHRHASAIKQRLQQQHGLRVQFALPPRETAGQRNRVNRSLFEEVDAVMVYYSQHEEWMVLTCQTVRKVFGKLNRPRPASRMYSKSVS